MAREVFWDTSGLFALFNQDDSAHRQTVELARVQRLSKRMGLTTDAVIGECCTLLTARQKSHLIPRLLDFSEKSPLLKVLHLDEQLVAATKRFLRAHLDHTYSFVDCSSFVVMSLRHLREAATTDGHFVEAGFQALLR
ncbi:MAG TPA: PIN domain-containing protein [Chthoniobacteraceae bacterium]|jgi:predicted nucleic acid-binding protein|nr:PIN domain-containing protein [Chthoniobacteraceae bacterium]